MKYRTSANATGVYYYYAYNSRGDIVGLYNADGSLYCTYTYDAWGNILSVKDSTGHEITVATDIANLQSLKYRGYVYDYETGLYYLQSRYYDPVTRRFINADGQLNNDILGNNQFAYCGNNPVIRTDFYGNRWDEPEYEFCNLVRKYFTPSNEYGLIVTSGAIASSTAVAIATYASNSYVPPRHFAPGVAEKIIADDLSRISRLERVSKSFNALAYGVAAIDVGIGIYDNIKNNASTKK